MVLPNGAVRWILARGESVREGSAPPTGIAGINIDITARKQVEEEPRQSKREARTRFREVPAPVPACPGRAGAARSRHALPARRRVPARHHRACGRRACRPLDLRDPAGSARRPRAGAAAGHRERRADPQHRGRGRHAAQPDVKVWWRLHVYYLTDDYGATPGIGLVAEDVTARKRAEHARDLLGRELSHRIKNLFAVVASIVTLSARGNDTLQAFARTIRARIEALGRAHDYVRPAEWEGGGPAAARTLHGLLAGLLGPYQQQTGERIRIAGDDQAIGPTTATALGLAFHEFATNAVKYGALSEPEGVVELACQGGAETFEVVWTERGGAPVRGAPTTEGFGSLLARRSITLDLGGTIEAAWPPEGLTIRVRVPLERLTA